MSKQHGLFLLYTLLLMLIDVGFLGFMVLATDIEKDRNFLPIIAVVLLLVIPANLFVAWRMAMGSKNSD